MIIQRQPSTAYECPKLTTSQLPAKIMERVTDGIGWVSVIAGLSCVARTVVQYLLQPEFRAAWDQPALRIVTLSIFFLSIGFMLLQRSGLLNKQRLLDIGMVFQVTIAFACAVLEGALCRNPNAVVAGVSAVAVWMVVCARLMPNAPFKCAITGVLCVIAWPLGYWVDLRIFGYQPLPVARVLVWILPLAVVAVWMYFLNKRTIAFYMQQQTAEEIGSYALTELVGKGGMGEVWRARHKTLARDAAIKIIRPEVLYSSTGRQEIMLKKRFEREAQVTASLRSPHTVALYDFGQGKCGAFYYVMELIEGVDLQTLVDRFGPMEPARVANILQQVAKSLDEAHRADLVHRDIKPRNILLGKLGPEYDFAKVLDFGLVKTLHPEDPDRTSTTMDGATTGTPAYLSPELALGNRTIDGRSDLYSLGCTAYFLLTGHMVFDEKTPTAYAIAHVQTPAPPISSRYEPHVPAGLEAVVMQLLEKDPSRRLQSAKELGRRLRTLPDVPDWSPEQAERWWETNLPEMSALGPADDTTAPLAMAAATT